jgi:hypothetical protein
MSTKFTIIPLSISICCVFLISQLYAQKVRSIPKSAVYSEYQQRVTTRSNHEFYVTNFGMVTYPGWIWPRGSKIQHSWGQGIWFGTKKPASFDSSIVLSLGYDINIWDSYFVPGSVDDGVLAVDELFSPVQNYIVYVSTDYSVTGTNTKSSRSADWPLRWVDKSKIPGQQGYIGDYVGNITQRKLYDPVFVSEEEMFSIYKDTDVRRNPHYRPNMGYPNNIDVQQTVLTWGSALHKDFVIFNYTIINKGGEKYTDCYLGIMATPSVGSSGSTYFYSEDPSLQLAIVSTGKNAIIGFDLLETPRVRTEMDSISLLTRYRKTIKQGDQIGAVSFAVFTSDDMKVQNYPYTLMSSGRFDSSSIIGFDGLIFSSGPFSMFPGDTARLVLCQMMVKDPGTSQSPPGFKYGDLMREIIEMDNYAQQCYSNGILKDLKEYRTLSVRIKNK